MARGNAALRTIVRRDTGAMYQEFLTQLVQASGVDTPTCAELARIDRKRRKKGSNDDWTHPLDPDAKITKMKDGRTHLAHKAEHAVDLETGAVVAVTVQDVYRNRRRIRRARGKRLLRQRGERLERPCAHLYETGRMRRVHLRGHDNIRKRLLVHAGGLNLGLLMRTLFGVGTPRGLQSRAAALLVKLWALIWHPKAACTTLWIRYGPSTESIDLLLLRDARRMRSVLVEAFATRC